MADPSSTVNKRDVQLKDLSSIIKSKPRGLRAFRACCSCTKLRVTEHDYLCTKGKKDALITFVSYHDLCEDYECIPITRNKL